MHDPASVMVHRLNSIATYFAAYPREEAVAGIADHIRQFWEPRMRRQLFAYVDAGGAGLHELVFEAVPQLKPGQSQ